MQRVGLGVGVLLRGRWVVVVHAGGLLMNDEGNGSWSFLVESL